MALSKLGFITDPSGHNSFVRNPPLTCANFVLKGGEAAKYIPPDSATVLIFSANDEFWVNTTGVAQVPQGNGENGSELNPLGYAVGGSTATISIVSPRDTRVSIAVYS